MQMLSTHKYTLQEQLKDKEFLWTHPPDVFAATKMSDLTQCESIERLSLMHDEMTTKFVLLT